MYYELYITIMIIEFKSKACSKNLNRGIKDTCLIQFLLFLFVIIAMIWITKVKKQLGPSFVSEIKREK